MNQLQVDGKDSPLSKNLNREVVYRRFLNFTWWVNRKDRSGRNVFVARTVSAPRRELSDVGDPHPSGTRWFLMPAGKEYKRFRIFRFETGKPETSELVKVVTEYLPSDPTVLAYKLVSVKAGYTYDVTWYYK